MADFGKLYDYNTENGVVIPQTSSIRETIEDGFKSIFGSDFSTEPYTTNGMIIGALTNLFVDICGVNAQNINSMNIEQAIGAFLDSLGAMWGIARLEGESMRDDAVYGTGENQIEIDGGIGELNIIFKAKSDKD